jgi:hypothetical protein
MTIHHDSAQRIEWKRRGQGKGEQGKGEQGKGDTQSKEKVTLSKEKVTLKQGKGDTHQ